MIEKYDFLDEDRKKGFTFFNSLMLESDYHKIKSIKNMDSSKLEVDLKINGVSIRVEDFNSILDDWAERVEASVKEQLSFLEKSDAVENAAVALLEKKCGDAMELLQDIENSSYKVYDK